jgi:hypothetical protein
MNLRSRCVGCTTANLIGRGTRWNGIRGKWGQSGFGGQSLAARILAGPILSFFRKLVDLPDHRHYAPDLSRFLGPRRAPAADPPTGGITSFFAAIFPRP